MANRSFPDVVLVGAECEESLALRYLEAALFRAGSATQLIPFNQIADLEIAASLLAASGAPLAGFSMVFTYRAREFAQLIQRSRELGYDGHIVVGGHFAAFNAENLLRDVPGIDSVGIGEGEGLMTALATRLDHLDRVPGLVWRDPDGAIHRNPPAPPVDDLASLARPTHRQPPGRYLGLPIANMLSSRGCTYACSFCSIAAWHGLCGGRRHRVREPEDVADEMAELYHRGYRIFNFHDDNFMLTDPARMVNRLDQLKEGLTQRGVGRIAFAIKSRPDSVTGPVFQKLKEMGLFRVFLGVEAGTDRALEQLGRRQGLDDNVRALTVLAGLQLHVCYNLLLFNPETILDDVVGSVAFMRRFRRFPMNFCRTEVYAGTPLEHSLREQGRLEGGYWGHGYHIRHPQAQLAFELMHETLFERHHGVNSLHHLTMRLDYEYHLLEHFFGPVGGLRDRTKALVGQINANSCGYLDDVAGAASRGFEAADHRRAFIAGLRGRIREDGRGFEQDLEGMLNQIRELAAEPRPSVAIGRRLTQAAASVGLAAAVAVTGSARSHADDTHMFEVAPEVTPVDPPPKEAPNSASPVVQRPPTGDAAAMTPHLTRVALPKLGPLLGWQQAVTVEIWLDAEGKVVQAALFEAVDDETVKPLTPAQLQQAKALIAQLGADGFRERREAQKKLAALGRNVVPLLQGALARSGDPEVTTRCEALIDQLERRLKGPKVGAATEFLKKLRFPEELLVGKCYRVTFTQQAMHQAWQQLRRGTHICEMAPAPLD